MVAIATAALGATPVPAHASSVATPAYYTYQAPGGAGTAGQRVIALTFDDGPGPYTPQVLSVLERYHVPATFFEVGTSVAEYPQYARQVALAGDPVENHTWSHADLTTIPGPQVAQQIDQTQSEIRAVTGQTPQCVRPPYNRWNATVVDQIAVRGLTTMSYSVDPQDWTQPGSQTIASRVVSAAFPGAVIDLHDGGGSREQTVAALPAIITALRSQGYRFVSICSAAPERAQAGPFSSETYTFGQGPPNFASVISNHPLVGAATAAGRSGYWLAAADGGVFSFGNAAFHGSAAGLALKAPLVGMAATSDGGGYWLVAADGGVFSFGDARFQGSAGAIHLDKPIVGMAADPATGGYWLMAADGGVFGYGAPYYGSRGGQTLPDSFFSILATDGGQGYLLSAQRPA